MTSGESKECWICMGTEETPDLSLPDDINASAVQPTWVKPCHCSLGYAHHACLLTMLHTGKAFCPQCRLPFRVRSGTPLVDTLMKAGDFCVKRLPIAGAAVLGAIGIGGACMTYGFAVFSYSTQTSFVESVKDCTQSYLGIAMSLASPLVGAIAAVPVGTDVTFLAALFMNERILEESTKKAIKSSSASFGTSVSALQSSTEDLFQLEPFETISLPGLLFPLLKVTENQVDKHFKVSKGYFTLTLSRLISGLLCPFIGAAIARLVYGTRPETESKGERLTLCLMWGLDFIVLGRIMYSFHRIIKLKSQLQTRILSIDS